MRKILSLTIAAALLIASFLGACSAEEETASETTPVVPDTVTVIDSAGRLVEITLPVDKVVITYSQLLLTVKALGVEEERIIALDKFTHDQYASVFTGLADVPTVGKNLFNLDMEKIVDLEPQVIISTSSTLTRNEGLEEQLEKVGIKFIGLDYDFENVESIIDTLGVLFSKEARAAEYKDFWFGKLNEIEAKIEALNDDEKVRVYWENTAAGYVTISSVSAAHEIVEKAGGYNIARDLEGKSPEVDPEWVITQDPDVIMHYPMGLDYQGGFGTTDNGTFAMIRDGLKARPGFDQIKAVQNDKVFICSQVIKTGAFENAAICYIAKVLYPDLFTDLDPPAYLKEMVEQYLGLDWAAMDGVFIYPDLLKQ